MKVKENIILYECDFCKKRLQVQHAMIKHENNCFKNPKNWRICTQGCEHLERVDLDVDFEGHHHPDYGTEMRKVEIKGFRCSLYDKLMFPFTIERKELHLRYPTTYENQQPMPESCDGFKCGTENFSF